MPTIAKTYLIKELKVTEYWVNDGHIHEHRQLQYVRCHWADLVKPLSNDIDRTSAVTGLKWSKRYSMIARQVPLNGYGQSFNH